MKQFRKTAIGIASACAMAFGTLTAGPASADVIQLGFILDSSGSIGSSGWNTIRSGLSSALLDLIPTNGTYEISVVSFAANASLIIDSVLIDSALTLSSVATSVSAMPFLATTTNYSAAFDLMFTTLNTGNGVAIGNAASTYVNFATDGVPNPTSANGAGGRTNMINAGVDNISIEGIGSGVNAAYLQDNICYPTPCDASSPYDFPSKGFYMAVADANAYAAAIRNKIRIVTNQVPEPTSIALVGLALLGAGAARRRAAKR